MTNLCPACGAVRLAGCDVYDCYSVQIGNHLEVSTRCLRRQLAQSKTENARLREERDRLADLLADALTHCPASYRDPIRDVLKATIAKAALDAKEKP